MLKYHGADMFLVALYAQDWNWYKTCGQFLVSLVTITLPTSFPTSGISILSPHNIVNISTAKINYPLRLFVSHLPEPAPIHV